MWFFDEASDRFAPLRLSIAEAQLSLSLASSLKRLVDRTSIVSLEILRESLLAPEGG